MGAGLWVEAEAAIVPGLFAGTKVGGGGQRVCHACSCSMGERRGKVHERRRFFHHSGIKN